MSVKYSFVTPAVTIWERSPSTLEITNKEKQYGLFDPEKGNKK